MTATLLLNASYEPLRVIPWHRAITLALLEKADILETYDGETIRSAHAEFAWPAVARLRQRVSWRNKGVRFSRLNVYRRDDFTCQFCGQRHAPSDLTFDHVVPKSQGGQTCWSNITTACVPCNQRKANRTPKQAGMALLSEPKEPKWFQRDLVSHSEKAWEPYLWM
jgi:5-methylcytosine-specific restriction endonuclease McrA